MNGVYTLLIEKSINWSSLFLPHQITLPKFNEWFDGSPKNDGKLQVRNLHASYWCHFQLNHIKLWEGIWRIKGEK